jgi:hypothetical protein
MLQLFQRHLQVPHLAVCCHPQEAAALQEQQLAGQAAELSSKDTLLAAQVRGQARLAACSHMHDL